MLVDLDRAFLAECRRPRAVAAKQLQAFVVVKTDLFSRTLWIEVALATTSDHAEYRSNLHSLILSQARDGFQFLRSLPLNDAGRTSHAGDSAHKLGWVPSEREKDSL